MLIGLLVPTPKVLELLEQVTVKCWSMQRCCFCSARIACESMQLGHECFSIQLPDMNFLVGVYDGKLYESLDELAPHCELRIEPEGAGDDEALHAEADRAKPLAIRFWCMPAVKLQNLFSTHFSGAGSSRSRDA
ncbi:hypothetical protein [Pseudomonas glycinae]|uniref:Uncharacterized protein n=1 Tax=Pseudomonas glycinae TaxID=1785145 RepID=A0ABM6QI27_9PSED|nr:hypothetical protein [Pseudomonas glycinae]AUG97614.1 hypothetical protein AWU82_29830 [Pseudomonas glycinae]